MSSDLGADRLEVVLGEHRGIKHLKMFENDGRGGFRKNVIDYNKEPHLGARVVDLDRDGYFDIVSIARDAPETVHVWRNDSSHDVK